MARYKMRSMRGLGAGAGKALQTTKRRARKLYTENKKKTMWFGAALLAGVAAYVMGYIKFNNPKQNS